jgi:hypothetical protein
MRLSPTPSPSFYNCQANFAGGLLSWVQHQETPNNLKGFIWYTNGHNADWFNSDLLYANGTPKPVYFVWRDWGSVSGAPMIVRDHHFPTATTPSGRMSASDQSEQMGVEPPLLDESAPVIDQPPDQSSHAPYPAPDLAEDAIPSSEPSLDQNAPLPTPTPTPVDTPTPGVDPTTEQTTPTPSLTPTP